MGTKLNFLALCFFIFIGLILGSTSAANEFGAYSGTPDSVAVAKGPEFRFVEDPTLFEENWEELGQPIFWRKIINLSPDTCLLNVPSTRQVLDKISYKDWQKAGRTAQKEYLEDLRTQYKLGKYAAIYATPGKNDFYEIEKVMPDISSVIDVFVHQGTNPWYAQAIMLIECPGKLRKSNVGAYGAFQLMKSVARDNGLVVNSQVDERKDVRKSALAAAQFIQNTCIPATYRMLNRKRIPYNDSDLWFRLLVLHVYHAGASNVNAALKILPNGKGGMELIKTLWQTSSGSFGNASQNYSQIALASLIEMQAILLGKYEVGTREDSEQYLGKFYLRKYREKKEFVSVN